MFPPVLRVDVHIGVVANILPWVLSKSRHITIRTATDINSLDQDNQGTDTRRGTGIALLNVIGQCGPLLGTNVFKTTDSPRYIKGMSICAAFTFFTACLALGLRLLLVWENKKLDEKYGSHAKVRVSGTGNSTTGESAVAEENYGPSFRYML